jgi:hypothetical protein
MMAALIGEVDLDTAEQAGMMVTPGTADKVALQLTSAEREELVRLVREELLLEQARPLRTTPKGSGG